VFFVKKCARHMAADVPCPADHKNFHGYPLLPFFLQRIEER
jgi:hypothetical protein